MTDRLQQVFEHKRASSEQFREVQRKHGLLLAPENLKADPATREGTIELHKGLHWINLELSEFIAAPQAEVPEELADVLHFLVEFAILAGFDWDVVPVSPDRNIDRLEYMLEASKSDAFVFEDPHTNARFAILQSLQVADLLKNKPWKQTLKPAPDPEIFANRVRGLFYWYGATVRTAGLDAQQLFDQFTRKESINYNRIATGV